jgi:hypothetical protein
MKAEDWMLVWAVSLGVSILTTLAIAWIPYLLERRKAKATNRLVREEWRKKVGL